MGRLLLTFDGSWDPPPAMAWHGVCHSLIPSSKTCADLIKPICVSAPPCTRIPAVAAGATSPASQQPSWLWLLPKACWGGHGVARQPPSSTAVQRQVGEPNALTSPRQDVAKHLVMLG